MTVVKNLKFKLIFGIIEAKKQFGNFCVTTFRNITFINPQRITSI